MFCSNCGTQIPDSSVFCPECGAKMIIPDQDEIPNDESIAIQSKAISNKEKRKTNLIIFLSSVVLLLLLAAGGTLIYFIFTGYITIS